MLKSLFPKLVALSFFLSALPLLLLFGIVIYLHSPGPFFFSQMRVGKDGKLFRLFKLRTMAVNAEAILQKIIASNAAMATEWKAYGCFQKDPRIAGPMAKLARQLSLDELPQLLNIVKGEMNWVGPRPLEVEFNALLNSEDRKARLSVKPGLTGLWQIGPRSYSDHRQMMKYDRLYLKNRGWKLDLWIVWRTVVVVYKRTGF